VKTHDSLRINDHVAATLVRIIRRQTHALSAGDQLEIQPNRARANEINPPGMLHAVGVIKHPLAIDDHRPVELCFGDIRFGDRQGLEGNDHDLRVAICQFRRPVAQLRDMFAARQSGQMAMKDEEQPFSGEIAQLAYRAVGVGQGEFDRRFSDKRHGSEGDLEKCSGAAKSAGAIAADYRVHCRQYQGPAPWGTNRMSDIPCCAV
jgi:hypothetical protein